MDKLFYDEIIEAIKMGKYLQAFESLKLMIEDKNINTHDLFIEWWSTKTKDEAELLEKAFDYEEEYFSDLRLIDYKDELFAVKRSNVEITNDLITKYNTGEEVILDESKYIDTFERDEILNWLTVNGWRFKLVDYGDDETLCGNTILTEKMVEISNKYNDKDTLLHEMIHIYEKILTLNELDDFVLLKLYDELLPKVDNLKKLISLDKHAAFKEHSILFILKSLKLDLELGYKLGTIYAYGREELYMDNLI